MSYEVERVMRTIFKRCVQCPTQTPTCPDCPKNQICSLVPQDCNACAHMTCIANPSPAPTRDSTNVGAIAGGVIGGVVFMAIIMFMLWRFGIKKRREQQELEAEEWEGDDIAQQKHRQQFNAMRSDAASTRTRGSIAGSFLSRASNIIQIAYIPGVTNRSGSGHNSLLATAPVPPIPAAYANTAPKSPLSNEGDALFFRPGDLRGSTYSDGSSMRSGNPRDTQYSARRETQYSITPSLARSSMMSDVYRDDATTEPMPAMKVTRAAPRMVSVKSSAASSPTDSPALASSPGAPRVALLGQSDSASSSPSAGSSFAKATQITVGKNKGRFPIARQGSDSSTVTLGRNVPAVSSPLVETAEESDEEDEHARARRSLIAATSRAADPAPLVQPLESPFFDASELQTPASSSAASRPNPYAAMSASVTRNERPTKRTGDKRGIGGLSAVMEEAAKRASADTNHDEAIGTRDASPFSDAHRLN